MDWSSLLLLACPLMMVFMMFGMKGSHNHSSHSKHSKSDQIIHEELNDLKAQNEQMRKEIQKLTQ